MYRYDHFDQRVIDERVAQFRDQTRRYLAGELSDDDFRPLRLQNGLYIQKHAPMLRIAIPYGQLSTRQLRALAHIGRKYDRGYGHFTTRQNLQFNWPRVEDVPDILADLARVEMHAIQTSGNCIRNITSDHFAGVAGDETVDPRPYTELVRQWSTLHPEFAYLPRKFKIAVTGATTDRAAILVHDIGLQLVLGERGEIGFRVAVGGGLGRTPMIGHVIREFLPRDEILNYLDAILRVYNRFGRRDNKYKARIKILVKERTPAVFTQDVEAEWQHLRGGPATVPSEEIERLAAFFVPPAYESLAGDDPAFRAALADNRAFANWAQRNLHPHKIPGYMIVTLSLKKTGIPPGDMTSDQMDAVAHLADRYNFGELRVSHEQNLIFTDVRQSELLSLWQQLKGLGLATPNIGLLTNIVCCPGGDFCSLANAKSIPIAEAIQRRFDDLDYLHDIGDLDLNISGCMNACGHHHVGHIGVLGVDKNGSEWYQVTIGGTQGDHAAIGKVIGPSFAADEMPDVVSRLIETYVDIRHDEERFVDTVRRVGIDPFKARVYAPLIKRGAVVDDAYMLLRGVATLDQVPEGVPVIVPLALWLAERDALAARGAVGVWLAPADDPAALAHDADTLAVIAIDFPSFTDGRGYSSARLLRERAGYRGELRAVGDVQRDQLAYLRQVGFDAFALPEGADAQAALAGLGDFSDGYQITQARTPWFRRRDEAGKAP